MATHREMVEIKSTNTAHFSPSIQFTAQDEGNIPGYQSVFMSITAKYRNPWQLTPESSNNRTYFWGSVNQ